MSFLYVVDLKSVRSAVIWVLSRSVTAIKLRCCRVCYPLSPTPPPDGGGAFLPSPLQGEGSGERVFWLNLMAVSRSVGTIKRFACDPKNMNRPLRIHTPIGH